MILHRWYRRGVNLTTIEKTESNVSENNALFLAISGMRGSGRTRLFKQLKSVLPGFFGDQTFAFFEDPFGGLPHPLLWAEEERERGPVSRLFQLWGILDDFNVKKLRPALSSHNIVIVDGYGLNALLYATAYVDGNLEDDESASLMHHQIVKGRVIGQSIPPPEYFITVAECESQVKYLKHTVPRIGEDQCREFIRKEERMIRDYFRPETGQYGELLGATLSIEEMMSKVVLSISQHLNQKRQAAA